LNSELDDSDDSESSDNPTIINESSDSLGPTELIDVPKNIVENVADDFKIQHNVTNDLLPILKNKSLGKPDDKKKKRNGLKLFVSAMDTTKVRV
jgi:hypothetical protein